MNLEKRKTTSSNKTLLYRCINTSIQIVCFILLAILFPLNVNAVTITILEYPVEISDQTFEVSVKVDGANDGTNYIRVDLYRENETKKYFGETYNGSDWYFGSSGKLYYPITILNKTSQATVSAQIGNPSSDEYSGPGTYKLKIRRYTSSGSQSQNDVQVPVDIQITYQTPSPTPEPTQNPTKTPSPTKTSTPLPTKTVTPSPKPTTTTTPTTEDEDETSSEIVGFITNENQTQTSKPQVAGVSISNNKTKVIAFIFVYIGLICLGFGIYSLYKKFKLEYNLKNAKN